MQNANYAVHTQHLITLEKRRSIIALTAGVLVLCCALTAILVRLEIYDQTDDPPLRYFTIISNLFSVIGAGFMIPYAVEGIRKKHFVLPRFVVLFQFAGATCVSITLVTTLAFLLPFQGIRMVTGTNLWLHLVAPVCTVILFLSVEAGISLSRREALLCLIPFFAYMAVYFIMVVLIGKENGGWSDFYMTQAFWPVWISALFALAIGCVVSTVLRILQNRCAVQTWKRITIRWSEDIESVDLLADAQSYGHSMGTNCTGGEMTIPIDIFFIMSERYGIALYSLIDAYINGALDSLEDWFENGKGVGLKKKCSK